MAALCSLLAVLPATRATAELLGYWTFDADVDSPPASGTTSTVNDSSGKGYHGTLITAGNTPISRYSTDVPPELAGPNSRSLNLTGANDFVQILSGNATSAFNFTNSFTIACWVKTWPSGDWGPWVAKNGENGLGYQLRKYANTLHVGLTLRGAGDDMSGDDTAGAKAGARWQHYCVTFDGINRTIYVNGVHARTQKLGSTSNVTSTTDPVSFGCRVQGGTAQGFSQPMMDNVAIFNNVLDPSEVAQLAAGVDPRVNPAQGRYGLSKNAYPWGYGEPLGVAGNFGYREQKTSATLYNMGDVRFALRNYAAPAFAGTLGSPVDRQNINYLSFRDPQSPGGFTASAPVFQSFLTDTGNDDNYMFYTATGCIRIPAGASADNKWTFWYGGDDGGELVVYGRDFEAISGNGNEYFRGNYAMNGYPTGNTNTFATITLPPGDYNLRHTFMEKEGGAFSELWAAPGAKTTFDGTFHLVGHTTSGGLALVEHVPLVELTTTTPAVADGVPAQVVLRYDKRFTDTATIDNISPPPTLNAYNGTLTFPAPAATTTYTLTGTRGGNTRTASVTVRVNELPSIASFTIDDNTLLAGAPMTLRWVSEGSSSVSIDNGAPAVTGASGSVTFPAPASTTTYIFSATNSTGTKTATATVTIGTAPVINSFAPVDSTILQGGSANVTWSTTNAATVSISPRIGAVATSGSTYDLIDDSTTYTLTATNPFAVATATTTVFVPLKVGVTLAGWTVNQWIANNGNPAIDSIARALALRDGTNLAAHYTATNLPFIDIGPGGEFHNDQLPPPLVDGDQFVMISTATLQVNVPGAYRFGINNDDGGRLVIDGVTVILDDANHGPTTTASAPVTLTAGTHSIEYLFFEQGGGMCGEVFCYVDARPALLSKTIPYAAPTTSDLVISEFVADNEDGIRDAEGDREDWIEIFNGTPAAINLQNYYLSDDAAVKNKWHFPAYSLPAGAYLVVFASGKDTTFGTNEFHTNFKLSNNGEHLGLYKDDGLGGYAAVDTFGALFPRQPSNGGYGHFDTELFTGYIATTTPGQPNFYSGFAGIVGNPSFSVKRGMFTTPFSVAITTGTGFGDQSGAFIRYTTDGSIPTYNSGTLYTGPIPISKTTVLRAAGFKPNFETSKVDTQTYLFLDDVITQTAATATALGFPSGTTNSQVYRYGMNPTVVGANPAAMKNALSAIPTISIVLAQGDFSDPANGVYSDPGGRGQEVPCSVEMLNQDGSGTGQFHINAGLRVRGGFSRDPNNPKHALRLFFNSTYEGALEYDVFKPQGAVQDPGTTHFEKLDLRTSQNYSWAYQNDDKNTFLREEISRDLQGNTGQPYSRCRYLHVYINGIYWGLYDTDERYEATFGETYFGGNENDYDTIKSAGNATGYNTEATDGYFDFVKNPDGSNGPISAWRDLWNQTRATRTAPATGDATYFRLQGLNPDGVTPHPTAKPLLDMDNLIDYLLVSYYCGSFDAPMSTFLNEASNNWFALRNRTGNYGGFRFAVHDFEHGQGTDVGSGTGFNQGFGGGFNSGVKNDERSLDRTGPWGLGDGGQDQAGGTGLEFNSKGQHTYESINNFLKSNPQYLHEDLAFASLEYRVRFWDRVHKHFFNQGALTDPKVIAQLNKRIPTVQTAILAEQARWGNTTNLTVNAWTNATNYVINWVNGGSNQTIGSGIGRSTTIVRQLRAYKDGTTTNQSGVGGTIVDRSLYPLLNAPLFSQFGGTVAANTPLTLTIPAAGTGIYQGTDGSGTIYYTTNGQDPRMVGGAVNPAALNVASGASFNLTVSGPVKARTYSGSSWSALVEATFVVGNPASSSNLVISEIHYHPLAPQTAAEQGYLDEDFEFIELQNISAQTIQLTGVSLSGGVTFNFNGSAVTTLAPGARVLVVSNGPAFNARYSALGGLPIAGQFDGHLADSGETIVLNGPGGPFRSVGYMDAPPWPTEADGTGYSLVLINPASNPDESLASNWRFSRFIGGSPGNGDRYDFATWLAVHGGSGSLADDPDHNGLSNLLEYALNASSGTAGVAALPTSSVTSQTVSSVTADYLTLTFTRVNGAAEDLQFFVEFSGNLTVPSSWQANGTRVSAEAHPNGTVTEVWRAPLPLSSGIQQFGRLRVTAPGS
jgi:hypothetical protein